VALTHLLLFANMIPSSKRDRNFELSEDLSLCYLFIQVHLTILGKIMNLNSCLASIFHSDTKCISFIKLT
jgi:hypothetical protein